MMMRIYSISVNIFSGKCRIFHIVAVTVGQDDTDGFSIFKTFINIVFFF